MQENVMRNLKVAIAMCTAIALPGIALAQSNDAKYCQALIDKYRADVGTAGTSGGGDAVPVAIAKCQAGDTAAGIPVLEKVLKDNKVTLPPRQ
jgi:hypothetical protein